MIPIHKNAMIFAGGHNGIPACHWSKSSASNPQTSNQSQVGVEGGIGVGSGAAGNIANENGITVNTSAGGLGSSNKSVINVTTDDAANTEAAFSTIDHLISMEASAGPGSESPSSGSPTILTIPSGGGGGGGSHVKGSGGSSSSTFVNFAVIGGAILTLIVFIRSKGKAE